MKHLQTFKLFENQQYGNFKELPNGDLEISLGERDEDDMKEIQDYEGDDDGFLWEFYEPELVNGYNLVPNDQKGLTEAPQISSEAFWLDEEPSDDYTLWYYDNYQITSVKDVLLADGKIVFKKHS